MRGGFLITTAAVAITAAAVSALNLAPITPTSAQANLPTPLSSTLKTPWGEPDLQGIWTVETGTPLQRPAKYADQEIFTEAQREELDKLRSSLGGKDKREARGTELDVSGSYNEVFRSRKPTGARTSLIVDPPDGRIPPLTTEAQKALAADREFRLALLQATETCRIKWVTCNGGKYDPTPSPRFAEPAPRYHAALAYINRHDGPEDGNLAERCLAPGLPLPIFALFGIGGPFARIVQTPGGISMFYDVGQGHGWQRNIVMDGSPHLPAGIRQWFGDSRGHWEGDTLVIDVTNFSPKIDFAGSRENLHLIERWTRTGPSTLEYVVTIEDPTVWTRPWTIMQEFTRQSEQANRIYYEPRCNEGNYGLPGLLRGARTEELDFAKGRGPDPATRDHATVVDGGEDDPLQLH
jgi:hypothetical protein